MTHTEQYNIYKSIRNLLDSSLSTKEIHERTQISFTTINELRNGTRNIEKTSFQNAFLLYNLSVENDLNEEYLTQERNKGFTPLVPVNLKLKKVIVSFEPLDLFAYGMLDRGDFKTDLRTQKDVVQDIPYLNAVFITKDGKILDCEDFGFQFNTRYFGTGPSTFAEFISNFSKKNPEKIREIVGTNSIVEYDFLEDRITTYPSLIQENKYILFKQNQKLIISLSDFDTATHQYLISDKNDSLKLSDASIDIFKIQQIMKEQYGLPSKIEKIAYIPSILHTKGMYTLSYDSEKEPYIKIVYSKYEIWISYQLTKKRGNIFKDEEMKELLEALSIDSNNIENNLLKSIVSSQQEINSIQTLVVDQK